MASDIIAFITEGEKSEPELINNVKSNFPFEGTEILPFKTNIYALYSILKRDEFETNIIDVLCERDGKIKEQVESVGKESIAQVYLFFDYDGHVPGADDEKIKEMLECFDNETENGKLIISYPMYEAVLDLVKDNDCCDRHCCSEIALGRKYKGFVSHINGGYGSVKVLNKTDWYRIINFSISKATCIVTDKYEMLEYNEFMHSIGQKTIFEKQEKKFIRNQRIAVLSGFPLFLTDFFGDSVYRGAATVSNPVVKAKSCGYIG